MTAAEGVAETPEHTGEATWIDVPGRRTRLAEFAFAPAHFHLVDWSGSPMKPCPRSIFLPFASRRMNASFVGDLPQS